MRKPVEENHKEWETKKNGKQAQLEKLKEKREHGREGIDENEKE